MTDKSCSFWRCKRCRLFGGREKIYETQVSPALLVKYDLTPLEVYQALSRSNLNVGGDVIEENGQAYVGILHHNHYAQFIRGNYFCYSYCISIYGRLADNFYCFQQIARLEVPTLNNTRIILSETTKITTITGASIGLMPAALSTGTGSESQKPPEIIIIGGLVTATV